MPIKSCPFLKYLEGHLGSDKYECTAGKGVIWTNEDVYGKFCNENYRFDAPGYPYEECPYYKKAT